MSRHLYSLISLLLIFCFTRNAQAQDDLLNMLKDEAKPTNEKVFATFKTSRLINAQTIETPAGQCLDFRVAHRFGNFLEYQGNGRGGPHRFFGLDDSNFDIRIAF